MGLKKHNGGAYLQHCIHYDSYSDGFAARNKTSSLKLANRNKTAEDVGDFLYYYDDPTVVTANITDVFDSSLNYTVLMYATSITNNNFTLNFSGMKGSALAIFTLSEL